VELQREVAITNLLCLNAMGNFVCLAVSAFVINPLSDAGNTQLTEDLTL
jgi:hypothetical protein